MKKVGITGGIGSGKTTVVAEFAKLGISCFVADKVGASYYNDPSFLADVRNLLGDGVFLPDGNVDKAAIARIVFADADMLAALNSLVHPRVMHDFDLFCKAHSSEAYVLFESAILYDYGFDRMMDCVIGVYLDLEERLQRIMQRDACDEAAIRARMANQRFADKTLFMADFVVLNYEGNPRQRQVQYIDSKLRAF